MALIDNLYAYWKFDESSGNASDATGNGYTLTNNNTVGFAAGKIGNCADFGTTNTTKYFSNTNVKNPSTYNTGLSFSFWVYFNTIPSSDFDVFTTQDTSWSGCFIRVHSAVSTDFRFGNGITSDGGTTNVTTSFSSGTWYHIVMTHSATANTYYINGSQVAQRTSNVTLSGGGTGLSIGTNYALVNYASTRHDETGVWTRELSSAEVTQLYNGGNGLAYPFTGGTINSRFFAFM